MENKDNVIAIAEDVELSQDTLDNLSEENASEQKLNKVNAIVDFDKTPANDGIQALTFMVDVKTLLAQAIRKVITDDNGKTVKKTPAVMLTFQVDKIPYIQNGIMYEIDLSLGQRGAGAYLPMKVRKVGKIVPQATPVTAA